MRSRGAGPSRRTRPTAIDTACNCRSVSARTVTARHRVSADTSRRSSTRCTTWQRGAARHRPVARHSWGVPCRPYPLAQSYAHAHAHHVNIASCGRLSSHQTCLADSGTSLPPPPRGGADRPPHAPSSDMSAIRAESAQTGYESTATRAQRADRGAEHASADVERHRTAHPVAAGIVASSASIVRRASVCPSCVHVCGARCTVVGCSAVYIRGSARTSGALPRTPDSVRTSGTLRRTYERYAAHLGHCADHPGHCAAHPGHCAAHPGHCAANPGLCAAHPGLCAAHPGLCAAHPGLYAVRPKLCVVHPGLCAVHPEL